MNLTRSSLDLFSAKVLSAVISFIALAYFAQELGANKLGSYFLFEASLGLISVVSDFGINGATEKRVSENNTRGAYLSSSVLLKTLLAIGSSIIIFIFRHDLNNYLGGDFYLWLIIALVIQEYARLFLFVLKGELRVGETAFLRISRQVTWALTGSILISIGYGTIGLISGLILSRFVMLVFGWYKCSIKFKLPTLFHLRSLFDFGKYNFVSSIGGYVYNWMDVVILGMFVTQSQIAIYEVAWRITSIPLLLSNAIAESVFPQISLWDSQNKQSKIRAVVKDSITASVIVVIPSFFGVLLLSGEILTTIFGKEYVAGSIVLIILMAEKIVQAYQKIIGRVLSGIDYPNLSAIAAGSSTITNLLLNVLLINQFGIEGAAIATTLSFILNTILHGYYLRRFIAFDYFYYEIVWISISSVIMSISIMIMMSFIEITSIFLLIILISIAIFVYSAAILVNNSIREKVTMVFHSLS